MQEKLRERIRAPGQKRILACDGGGIRGLISIEVLAEIEKIARKKTGQPDLVLAEYFDYFAGTSTGRFRDPMSTPLSNSTV